MNTLAVTAKGRSLIAGATAGALVAGWLALSATPATALTDWQSESFLVKQSGVFAPVNAIVKSSADGQKITSVWTLDTTDNTAKAQVQTRSSADGGKTWGEAQTLSEPADGAPRPSIAASTDGNTVTVVYLVPDNQLVAHAYSRTSTDAGATWGAPVNVTPDVGIDGALDPQVASSADGKTLAVVWTTSSSVWSAISTDGGVTWSAQKRLTGPNSGGTSPALAISDNGKKIAASWNGVQFQGNDQKVTVSVSSDTGETWSSPRVRAGSSETQNYGRQIVMSGDGSKVHVIWTNSDGDNAQSVRTASSTDSGASWTDSTEIGSSKTVPIPMLAASANGSRVYAAWTDGVDAMSGTIKVRTSADSGATWAAAVPITSGAKYAAFPQLAASSDGTRATMVWVDDQPPIGAASRKAPLVYKPVIQASSTTDSGATWEATKNLSSNSAGNMSPQLAMSADGTSMITTWNRIDLLLAPATSPQGAPEPVNQNIAVLYSLGSATPTPPTPPVTKKAQKPANGKGKPPARIKRKGVTVITGSNARTNAGQLIRTRVRCVHGSAAAGEKRYCTVIRGPKGKVSLRTYGRPNLKVVVVQYAPATSAYKAYRKRTVYLNGRKT